MAHCGLAELILGPLSHKKQAVCKQPDHSAMMQHSLIFRQFELHFTTVPTLPVQLPASIASLYGTVSLPPHASMHAQTNPPRTE